MGRAGDSELLSVFFGLTAASATSYAGTRNLPGVWLIREVVACADAAALSVDAHNFGIAAATEIPSSSAEMDKAEPVFPDLHGHGGLEPLFSVVAASTVVRVSGRFRFQFGGRRLVCAWSNNAGANAVAQLVFVMERVGR